MAIFSSKIYFTETIKPRSKIWIGQLVCVSSGLIEPITLNMIIEPYKLATVILLFFFRTSLFMLYILPCYYWGLLLLCVRHDGCFPHSHLLNHPSHEIFFLCFHSWHSFYSVYNTPLNIFSVVGLVLLKCFDLYFSWNMLFSS